ncbi:hypothetical protein CISIN_1g048365mg [Citrus sinensis]|uniref:Uncharacterized protein n=1 Tax=Citrus sinensis TaxID=2711 RepID=A0A067FC25_CITSI|nr:hypothetical protein CISIN_1g048365mg [Citrus sinensis]
MSKFEAFLHDSMASSCVFRLVDSAAASAGADVKPLLSPFFRTYFRLPVALSLEFFGILGFPSLATFGLCFFLFGFC